MKKATVKIGIQFRYSLADTNPMWTVIEARGRGTWICTVNADCPDYGGFAKCFSTEEIQRSIGLSNFWDAQTDASEAFYASLEEGQIVHYNHAFGGFVRCRVIKDKKLLPIALVGNWLSHDLPRRNPVGVVYLGFHAEKIQKKETYQPHASNLYEFSDDLKKKFKNPRTLAPIDLSVPEMTEKEMDAAAKVNKLNRVRKITEEYANNPDEAFNLIKILLG